VSIPNITIINNFFDGTGVHIPLIELPEGLDVSILLKDERLDYRATLSKSRLLHFIQGKTGTVRIGPCPKCGKMGVYENGEVVHDPDFDLIEEVMET